MYNLKISSLSGLYSKMPIFKDVADLQNVDQEWRSHSMNPKKKGDLTPEEYWQILPTERLTADERDLAGPNLFKVVKVLFSFPFSKAGVERVFSQLKLIKTNHRSSLKQDSLLALLSTKMMILKSDNLASIRLEPSKEMFTLHKNMVINADNDDVWELRKDFLKKINITK